jgi:lipopolysaccharide heptosyltransferase I
VNILIVKLSAIGDVTQTLPALVALRRHYPDAHIAWLVEDSSAQVVEGHDALNRVLVWRRREFQELWRRSRWISAFRLLRGFIRDLRDTHYDLVIDFQALLKSAVWVKLSRAKRKAGFGPGLDHSEGSHHFLNERVPAISMEVHALDRGLKLLEGIGVSPGRVEYRFAIGDDAAARAAEVLREQGRKPEQPLVVIHAMARWRTKLWFADRFASLADRLVEQGMQVAFTGAPSDKAEIDNICSQMKKSAMRLDGRGGLKLLAAILEQAEVVVSTDTGPMHLAVAVGTPVVALFGPTAPNRTGPHGANNEVLRAGVACSPCFKRECRTTVAEHMACMKGIAVDAVVDAVRQKMSKVKAEPQPLS